jgi:hypothetical protein
MREVVTIEVRDILPDQRSILKSQGIPSHAGPGQRVQALLAEAQALLRELAMPVGLWAGISREEFAEVYRGEGRNAPENPLLEIYPRAERLALFAVTLGEEVSARIANLFRTRDFALASLLDSAASESAERAADALEAHYARTLETRGLNAPATALLRYSPGYCGWDVSGQGALFAALKPGQIGIALRESFLMDPLKSISGVLIAGPAEIHAFADSYPFCDACRERGCRQRIRRITSGQRNEL